MHHPPRSPRRRIAALTLALLAILGVTSIASQAQHPHEWNGFDAADPVRQLENRFALIASDGLARAGTDAQALASTLRRYGWSVRLFAEGKRAPKEEEWLRDWRDLASTCGTYDTVMIAWISAGPPPDELGPWMRRLAVAPAAQRILLVDALRRSSTEPPALPDPPPLQPSWRDEIFTVLASAWAQPSFENASPEPRAPEQKALANGLYLDAFLRALAAESSDLNGDEYLSLREVHHAASARAARRAFELGSAQRAAIVSQPSPGEDAWMRHLAAPVEPEPAGSREAAPPEAPRRAERAASQPIDGQWMGRLKLSRASAIRWLLQAQSEDGRWDADAFPFDGPAENAGRGASTHDVGVTGLAILALLGTEGFDESKSTKDERAIAVERGVRWLLTTFDAEGILGGRSNHAFLYDHAIGTYALCEALAARDLPSVRAGAERAVQTVLRARNPYYAWRYELPPNGENDTSMTLWMALALDAARRAKIEVDRAVLGFALNFLDEMTDLETGRCGYINRGEPPARPVKGAKQWPASSSESLTAGAALLRQRLRSIEDSQPAIEAHLDLVLAKPPQASDDGSTHDFYYWSFGARALEGNASEKAQAWRRALGNALLRLQTAANAPGAGSFAPTDPWGEDEGRVGTTAHALLALNALAAG
ncbi:MAG: hypothetical protein JNM84_07755 [Planctomycetes bacterium]|nr:hypothetical protein [Planctomycetota bacterium]